jgi:hypothetical protein
VKFPDQFTSLSLSPRRIRSPLISRLFLHHTHRTHTHTHIQIEHIENRKKEREKEREGEREREKMIKAILIFNNNGKPRLSKFYEYHVSI